MSSGVPSVLPDANVLYSRTLRDWICLLATRSGPPLFHLRWTEDILAELVYHLRKNHPYYSDRQIGGVRDKIVDIVAVHGRISGYEIDPALAYPDEYDAHLHAAAEHGDVHYVLTNDRGFHEFAAHHDDRLGYEVYTPDDFLMLVYRDAVATVREALLDQIAYHRRLGTPFNLAARLEAAQAPHFAAAIREMMQAPAVAQVLARGPSTTE
ncbi:PIN domain-containing protein [Rhodococcus aetherivorans]|uniref:PIN domain-containing protein n=1 Tax=Rhodococcus aetherivorans TaxID=191292 RepID=UPI00163B354F|nr:PIN domain-containing protein [Rhodococcus aetherivorans]MBC2586921.1 hypothetical protein [Rhodococcus aetherivorans]